MNRLVLKSLLALGLALVSLPARAAVQVYVGFADTSSAPKFFPNPWNGSPNTLFLGASGTGSYYHSAAILVYNSGPNKVLLGQGNYVDGFGTPSLKYQLWDSLLIGGRWIAPGSQAILTQTAAPGKVSNFDPTQDAASMSPNSAPSPVIHLNLNGQLTTFTDTAHTMVIGGSNWSANLSRNESLQWRPVGTFGPAVAAGTGINPPSILTWHNDNMREGSNSNETGLNGLNATPTTFGELFQYSVDGQIYGQPLYVPGVLIGGIPHNVVYVATMHNSVYAFDADQPGSGAPLWSMNAGPSIPASDLCAGDQYPEYGITSTPVIDLTRNVIYVVSATKTGPTTYASTLHALDLGTGSEQFNGPTVIQASVAGLGEDNDGHGNVVFNALYHNQRSSLLLWNNVVYITYGSHCDVPPYHGWILGYNAGNISQQTCAFNTTPDATTAGGIPAGGSMWMAGAGPSTDGTAMYVTTANGTFDVNTGGRDYGDSILKLVPSGSTLQVQDYFTPADQDYLNQNDLDYGSSVPLLMGPQAGFTFPILVQTTKTGRIYIVNRTTGSMGEYNTTDQVWKETGDYSVDGGAWGNPATAFGTVYFGGAGGTMRGFSFSNGAFLDQTFSHTVAKFLYPGLTPTVSYDAKTAKSNQNVLVWAIENSRGKAVLHAFSGYDLREYYNGSNAPNLDDYVKFTTPTVAGGKVYVGGASKLTVYGGAWFTPAPTISVLPQGSTAQVTITTTVPNGTIHYTLDGTDPTSSSTVYSGPFTMSASGIVRAQVCADQYIPGKIAVQNVTTGTTAISVRCGGASAGSFLADAFYTNGTSYSVTTPVSTTGVLNPAPQAVYENERWGDSFSYIFTGLKPAVKYQVRLHFAEIYDLYPGMRVFNVTINGVPALTNFDIVNQAGGPFKAIVETFIVPAMTVNPHIQIDFQGVVDNAKVSGIEVAPAPAGALTKAARGEEVIMLRRPDAAELAALSHHKHIRRDMNGMSQAQRAAIQRAYRCRMQNLPMKARITVGPN